MNRIEKFFGLKRHPLFASLENEELILIAEIAISRRFAPGSVVAESDSLPRRLYVITSGHVYEEDGEEETSLPLIGVESLLLDKPLGRRLLADSEEGAECLVIGKGHFFTIINECPEILARYLESNTRPSRAASPTKP